MMKRKVTLCLLPALLVLFSGAAQAQWSRAMQGVRALAFSPDGRYLAAGSIEDWVSPGDLRVWRVKDGKLVKKVRYVYGVDALRFSPDSKTLAVVANADSFSETIRLWDVKTWRLTRKFGKKTYLDSLDYSPDGKRLVVGSNMGENGETDNAYLWNLPSLRRRTLPNSAGLSDMHFSPRGDVIVGAFYSGVYNDDSQNIRAWNAASGRFLWKRNVPLLKDLAFTTDGRHFLVANMARTGSSKGFLQIWQARTGRLLHSIPQENGVQSVAASPDGKWWATSDSRDNLRLWNARTRRVVRVIKLQHRASGTLTFSPDSQFIASAGNDMVLLTRLKSAK